MHLLHLTSARTRRIVFLGLALILVAVISAACGSDSPEIDQQSVASEGSATAVDNESSDEDGAGNDDGNGDHGDGESHADDGADHDDGNGDHGDDHAMAGDDSMDHADEGGHGNHAHAVVDAGDVDPAPAIVDLAVTADPLGGWTGRVTVANHIISPLAASTDHVPGEGHMHLYVDGARVGRLYNEWFHLPALGAGDHEIRVELSANNHGVLAIDETPIDMAVQVTEAADGEGHGNHHDHGAEGRAAEGETPSVTIGAFEDPKGGWNVHVVPTNFTFAPQQASGEHVDGEGHVHLYLDGTRIARLYGGWHHVPEAAAGEHVLAAELAWNDHVSVAANGVPVRAETIVMGRGPADDASPAVDAMDDADAMDEDHGDDHQGEDAEHSHADATGSQGSLSDADQVLNYSVSNGAVSGDSGRQRVELGSVVALVVDLDTPEEVHVHGYDVLVGSDAPGTVEVVFTADIPGLFEVELEQSGELIVELEVR